MKPQPDNQDQKQRYLDELQSTKRLLERAIYESQQAYDRTIITLSSGAIALSVTVIRDLTADSPRIFDYLLYGSWVLFAFAIGCVLFSVPLSIKSCAHLYSLVDAELVGHETTAKEKVSPYGKWVMRANTASGLAFFLGVALTLIISIATLEGTNMSDKVLTIKDREERGYVPSKMPRKPEPEQEQPKGPAEKPKEE